MKGKTQIILTNVETGEQEIHEDENLITNALDKFIGINMSENYAPNTNILPIAEKALGGLMLFDEELTEDPDNIHFPAEAHLVGYADRDTNVSDKYRGSFNSIESGKIVDGYKSVWDFGTAQANGTIKSVALTSHYAGANPFYYYNGPDTPNTYDGAPRTDANWMPIRYDSEYVYMIKADSTTHTMRIARTKIPMVHLGSGDYSDVDRSYEVLASWNTEVTTYDYYDNEAKMRSYTDPHTVVVYADDALCYEDGHDGYIYCVFYGPNKQYTHFEYDIVYFTIKYDDESFEKSEIHYLRGTSFWSDKVISNMYCAYRIYGHAHNGFLYRISIDRKFIVKVPLDNPGAFYYTRIIADDSQDYIASLDYICSVNGHIYFEVMHYTSASNEVRYGVFYPDRAFLLSEVNYSNQYLYHGSNNYRYTRCRTCDDDLTVWGIWQSNSGQGPMQGTYNIMRTWAANYLGTINNLGMTIEKTAAQTMKVIYTLTDIDSEPEPDDDD